MPQNRKITLLVLLFGLLLSALAILLLRPQPSGQNLSKIDSSKASAPAWETKTDNQAEVTVLVTPIILKAGEAPKFDIAFNTHSVDLGFNPADRASLSDDRGQTITVSKWVGSTPGGHHRSGKLDFNGKLEPDVLSVTLTLKNIAGIDRVFTWSLP